MVKENIAVVNRQLNDVLSQIERILAGADDFETLENFSRYSEEMKSYFRQNSTNDMILERVKQIPVIDLQLSGASLVLVLISSFASRYREQLIRKKALEDIKEAQRLYSPIEFLFKAEQAI